MTNQLSNTTMLVTLKFSMWSARKKDKAASIQINTDKNSIGVTVTKPLMINDLIKAVTTAKGDVYSYHVSMTLPWLDSGVRMLPSKLFTKYTDQMNTLQSDFWKCVHELVDNWDHILTTATSVTGDLYDALDYPTKLEIEAHYGCEYKFMPTPTEEDFRSDISTDQAKLIRADIVKQLTQASANAQKEVFERVSKCVSHMATSLQDFVPKTKTTKQQNGFHNSVVENLSTLASILPSLNINDDPVLTKITDQIKEQLITHTASDLKTSNTKRKDTAAKAKAISEALDDLI